MVMDDSNMVGARFPKPLNPTLWVGSPGQRMCPEGWEWPVRQEVEVHQWFFTPSGEQMSWKAFRQQSISDLLIQNIPLITTRTSLFKNQHSLPFYSTFYLNESRNNAYTHPPPTTHTHTPSQAPSPPYKWISKTWQILGLQGQDATRKQQDGELRTARQRRSLIDSCKALGVRQKLVKNSCCWVLIDNVFILMAETLQTVVGLRRSPSLAHKWTHTHTDNGKSFNRWLRRTQPQYLKKTTCYI